MLSCWLGLSIRRDYDGKTAQKELKHPKIRQFFLDIISTAALSVEVAMSSISKYLGFDLIRQLFANPLVG